MKACWIFYHIPHDKPFHIQLCACLGHEPSDPEVLLKLGDITSQHVRCPESRQAGFDRGCLQDINGTEVVLTKPLGQVKGLVMLFHGCQHSALDWGYASATCPKCLGTFTISSHAA